MRMFETGCLRLIGPGHLKQEVHKAIENNNTLWLKTAATVDICFVNYTMIEG